MEQPHLGTCCYYVHLTDEETEARWLINLESNRISTKLNPDSMVAESMFLRNMFGSLTVRWNNSDSIRSLLSARHYTKKHITEISH